MWFVDVNYTVSDYVFRIKSFFCHKLSSILVGKWMNPNIILEGYKLGWINEKKNLFQNYQENEIQKVPKELGRRSRQKSYFF